MSSPCFFHVVASISEVSRLVRARVRVRVRVRVSVGVRVRVRARVRVRVRGRVRVRASPRFRTCATGPGSVPG